MKYVDLFDDKCRKETGVDAISGSSSQPKIQIKKREGGFDGTRARALGVGRGDRHGGRSGLDHGSTNGDDAKDKAKAGVDAKAAFARLKTLKGTWKSQIKSDDQSPEHKELAKHDAMEPPVVYKLTGAGSAVVETQFPGTGHEMVSVYHLDGDDLRMTHYCAAGNQPRVKLDRAHSTPDQLIFVFDGGTNLDPEKDHAHPRPHDYVSQGWQGQQCLGRDTRRARRQGPRPF